MSTQYFCKNERRRHVVREQPDPPLLNGIDYLEVSEDQLTLTVHFIHNLPGQPDPAPPPPKPALTKDNITVEGGVRIKNVRVESIATNDNVLTVTVNAPGDFSTYTLRLVQSPVRPEPPEGFDPQLSAVDFSFKVDCPSDFDCAPKQECPPDTLPEPEINYLAKDYASFRRLVLDRLSTLMPDWRERNPADVQVMLVELLAHVGDHLSYFQDAVATEAYLGTAHQRRSIRRHARLLDYFVHDGCNACAWITFEVRPDGPADGLSIPAGTPLLTRGSTDGPMIDPTQLQQALAARPLVFETKQALALRSAHNTIKFYAWSDSECCLPRGATRATLHYEVATPLSLSVGDILIFEEVQSPTTGLAADADPTHRHAVRLTRVIDKDPLNDPLIDPLTGTRIVEIEWAQADALPFPVCVSAVIQSELGNQVVSDASVARGNVVLADHGLTIEDDPLIPSVVPDETEPYRPRLANGPLTYEGRLDLGSAYAMMHWDIRKARPRITLSGEGHTWDPQYDLLSSDSFRPEFVVEMESDGVAHLRFGDGVLGRQPAEGAAFTATYRIGNGAAGNVGAEAIARVVLAGSGIDTVRNPIAASGGTDPEPIEQVRLYAPQAFRVQQRAVTEADYTEVAQRHPDIQRAVATIRWTGSWYTAFVTIDRKGGRRVDARFEEESRAFLERYRIAGYDLEIDGPVLTPLDIVLQVCVKPGYFRSQVKQALLETFSNRTLPNGTLGFFHPDHFTFGQPVYLSQIYQAALEVPGVASVDVITFQRWGKAPNQEIENGVLKVGTLEVITLDNDPNFPENGKIEFQIEGGL